MPKGYHHLTYEQRCQISALNEISKSQNEIAKVLGVHRSSISREIKRNSSLGIYSHEMAQNNSILRRSKKYQRKKIMNEPTIKAVENTLKLKQWSPQQISGRLKKDGIQISHETIYKHIWDDKKKGGTLHKYLRHKGKKYQKRGNLTSGRGLIPNRKDIDARPKIVDKKLRFGDFEIDTIIGTGNSGAILSIVDRASKLTKLAYVFSKSSDDIEKALIEKLTPFKDLALTITSDNGKEFANHQNISSTLDVDFYFAKPYQSWQRGLNEHTNGLVRQYFPKNLRFDEISDFEIQIVEDLLNNRPRKVLNYETPLEVFNRLSKQTPVVALHT